MNELQKLLDRWKKEDHRMTPVRAALLDLFLQENPPLSLPDIKKILKKKRLQMHRSTLYRELEFLQNEGFLSEILLDKKQPHYESTLREHHHHLYCRKCKRIEEIELPDELTELERTIQKNKKFKIHFHRLEFFGLCNTCKNSP